MEPYSHIIITTQYTRILALAYARERTNERMKKSERKMAKKSCSNEKRKSEGAKDYVT